MTLSKILNDLPFYKAIYIYGFSSVLSYELSFLYIPFKEVVF
jgi:hypothetical protein